MADKLATAFRLHLDTVKGLDALVESPPEWLEGCAPGPVENRTEVIERLVFLAVRHRHFGMPTSDRNERSPEGEGVSRSGKKPSVKGKR